MYIYIYDIVYVVCIVGFGTGMVRVRVFGGGDYKIIPTPYPSGFSFNPTIPANIGEIFWVNHASIWAGRALIGYGEIAIPSSSALRVSIEGFGGCDIGTG